MKLNWKFILWVVGLVFGLSATPLFFTFSGNPFWLLSLIICLACSLGSLVLFRRSGDPTKIKVNLDNYHIDFKSDGLVVSRLIAMTWTTPNGSRDFPDKDLRKIERIEKAIIGYPQYSLDFNKYELTSKSETFDSVYLVKHIKREEGNSLNLKRELQTFEWVFRGN